MRKRIYRISEDRFDDPKPNIEFDFERFDYTCFAQDSFDGNFSFRSTNGISARGVVYCSNPYVHILEPWFDSEKVTISFTVDDLHFKPSDKLEGVFTVLSVGIEKEIPFSISYVRHPIISSSGEIKSLEDFCDFAQSKFTEAVKIFYSKQFEDFVYDLDKKTRLIYKGYKAAPLSPINVDSFFVSCGLKEKMTFDLSERTDYYYGVSQNIKGEIELTRSTWGFIDIKVSSDADFISVEKEHITADFFLGSIFNMNYYVHKEKMHPGLNYGKISFDYRDIHKEITIVASFTEEGVEFYSDKHNKNKALLKLCRTYEDFRLRKITTGQWTQDTLKLLENFSDIPSAENYILLIKALAFITNKQRQEALWIIQDLKRTIDDKRSFEWAFLLYLCTLIEREESYVDRLTNDIEDIYRHNSDDIRIFWFLLFLRKEYVKNPSAKLRAIAEWVNAGADSPLLFVEAYYVFLQEPYLISDFDDFTLKILNWAKKRKAITKDIAIQAAHVAESQRKFNPKAFSLLSACYEVYPELDELSAIVGYLLKAPELKAEYLPWFRMAIDASLRVAGIFEAYINCLPKQSVEQLPQIVTMFFKYNNELSYDRKALLYANIILHKDTDLDSYKEYERTIESFSLEQLKLGRLDDNLAICYQNLMEKGIFDSEVARLISGFIFRKKLAVISPNIKRVFLYQDEFKNPTIANVSDNEAFLLYMGSEGVIFLEDNEGHLTTDTDLYLVNDIMHPEGYVAQLHKLAPLAFPFILYDFASKNTARDFDVTDIEAAELFLQSPMISEYYRNQMYPKIIELLRNYNREEILEKHFMHEAKLENLSSQVIAELLSIFLVRTKYEEAYALLETANCSLAATDVIAKICQYAINKKNNQPDDFLILLSADLLSKNCIHSDIVYYLVRNFVGPTDLMIKIYENAFEEGHDVVEFCERILTQVLYRGFMCENIMNVFDAYMTRKTNKMIVEAFLTFMSHEYLSKETEIPENIFGYIYSRYKKAMPVNDSMRIALLKFLCQETDPDEEDSNMLDMLLADAIIRNQYFGFFLNCDRKLQIKYHLYDKHFVEFKSNSKTPVKIVYSINGSSPVEEDMIEMYDGLYVRQFILFFGDELKYEIYSNDSEDEPKARETYIKSDLVEESNSGRYSLMNSIIHHKFYQETDELAAALKQYQGLDFVTKELFTTV